MKATFTTTKKGVWAYIQKSVRIDGKSTTKTIKRLGLLDDIKREQGCADPRQWVIDLAARMTQEEKAGLERISIDFFPGTTVAKGERPLRMGGDLMLLPLYAKLGLPEICSTVAKSTKAKYDLYEILRTLVTGRLLFPASKSKTRELAMGMVRAPGFKEEQMFRALSLMSGHLVEFQAQVYRNSTKFMERRDRIIYYDCTNYYFEIEDNDPDVVDKATGEVITGLRKVGKSKENRTSPIVQMGMFMDMEGIPLAFVVFPGNESEQASLKPLEETLCRDFGMTDFIVSTDAGLASEDNRRSQQSPLNYIETVHTTKDGQPAVKTQMVIKEDVLKQEEALDGFYGYATPLDDEAALVLKARSFHHEIEHLFRTTKTELEARPVHLSRQDRIRSHFLICFLALTVLRLLRRQVMKAFPEAYKEKPLSVDKLLETLKSLQFTYIPGQGYLPAFTRTDLTDQLQQLAGIEINKQIIKASTMTAMYRKVNKS